MFTSNFCKVSHILLEHTSRTRVNDYSKKKHLRMSGRHTAKCEKCDKNEEIRNNHIVI